MVISGRRYCKITHKYCGRAKYFHRLKSRKFIIDKRQNFLLYLVQITCIFHSLSRFKLTPGLQDFQYQTFKKTFSKSFSCVLNILVAAFQTQASRGAVGQKPEGLSFFQHACVKVVFFYPQYMFSEIAKECQELGMKSKFRYLKSCEK